MLKRLHKFKSNVTDNISLSLMSIIQYKKLEKLFLWVQTVQTHLVCYLESQKENPSATLLARQYSQGKGYRESLSKPIQNSKTDTRFPTHGALLHQISIEYHNDFFDKTEVILSYPKFQNGLPERILMLRSIFFHQNAGTDVSQSGGSLVE